jgi:hypothetical protein
VYNNILSFASKKSYYTKPPIISKLLLEKGQKSQFVKVGKTTSQIRVFEPKQGFSGTTVRPQLSRKNTLCAKNR